MLQVPQFDLFPSSEPIRTYLPSDRQLGLLSCFYRHGWILSWNEYSVYVVDVLNQVLPEEWKGYADALPQSCMGTSSATVLQ